MESLFCDQARGTFSLKSTVNAFHFHNGEPVKKGKLGTPLYTLGHKFGFGQKTQLFAQCAIGFLTLLLHKAVECFQDGSDVADPDPPK